MAKAEMQNLYLKARLHGYKLRSITGEGYALFTKRGDFITYCKTIEEVREKLNELIKAEE